MKRYLSLFVSAAICAALPVSAQEAITYPAPSEIVAAAKADDWVAIESSDLLVMDLTPDSKGKPRRVVIQLIPEPFSQGWVRNIRKLAAAQWWDGTSINRVQDNYVVQWGDATEQKALPEGLAAVPESEYISQLGIKLDPRNFWKNFWKKFVADFPELIEKFPEIQKANGKDFETAIKKRWESSADPYAKTNNNFVGWPIVLNYEVGTVWPIHCYGMVGVGRNLSPDTGTGAELYTVIGHAPRHLDRNIALVGRVIEGIEHMSSLPRGTGALGFYEKEEDRVPIISVRLGNEAKDVPAFEYLDTDSASFAAYAEARANRRDPFFNVPAGGADICNIPVPVRRKAN